MLTFFALLVIVIAMLARNGGVGFLIVAMVWLSAAVFNPNIDSGTVWLIGLGLGYLLDVTD